MNNDLIARLTGRQSVLASELVQLQQEIADNDAALKIVTEGYESDQAAIAGAVSLKLEAAKAALN
jgi:hypothetical protein